MCRVKHVIPILLILAFLTGCGANPSIRAGDWIGNTPYGDFKFNISQDGLYIEGATWSFDCYGESGNAVDVFFPREKIQGRKFNFEMIDFFWNGEFSSDGQTLSGEWRITQGGQECVTDFEITR